MSFSPKKKIIILCLFNWTKKKKKKKTEQYIPVLYFVCRKTVVSAVSRTKQRRTAEVAKGDRKSHYHHLTLSVICHGSSSSSFCQIGLLYHLSHGFLRYRKSKRNRRSNWNHGGEIAERVRLLRSGAPMASHLLSPHRQVLLLQCLLPRVLIPFPFSCF